MVIVAEVHVLEWFGHARTPRCRFANDAERGRVATKALDLIAVDKHRAILPHFDNLVPARRLVPDKTLLPKLVACDPAENAIPIVGHAIRLLTYPTMIASNLVHTHRRKMLKQTQQHGFDQIRRLKDHPEQRGVNLKRLARKRLDVLNHVAAEHHDNLIDRMVGALNLSQSDRLLHDAMDALNADLR